VSLCESQCFNSETTNWTSSKVCIGGGGPTLTVSKQIQFWSVSFKYKTYFARKPHRTATIF
jgi:hypothetical protein